MDTYFSMIFTFVLIRLIRLFEHPHTDTPKCRRSRKARCVGIGAARQEILKMILFILKMIMFILKH